MLLGKELTFLILGNKNAVATIANTILREIANNYFTKNSP
jgi:hypothetical protein